jgi:DNA polymerase
VYAQPDTDAAQPSDALTMPEVAQLITAPQAHAPALTLAESDSLLASLPLDEPSVELMPARPESLPSWGQLQAQVAACQRCRLSQSRTQTVFGRGNPAARWLFVGEAPGEQEDLQGLPFVGPAGKLLDNMLAALGLDREQDIYIANVLKCRPPKNRNPQGDEIAACQPYLRQQIALQQPAVIVALGRFAAQTLLDSEASIGSLRGRVHQYAGVPLVVSYHPAYLLRSLPEKAKAWQDLLRARQVAQTGG